MFSDASMGWSVCSYGSEAQRGNHYNFNQISPSFYSIAINCTNSDPSVRRAATPTSTAVQSLPDAVRSLISNSLSPNTKRAYAADLRHHEAWGGTIPSAPEQIAEYLVAMAQTNTAATISRRLASLSKAHRAIGVDDACKTEIVKATMRGIRRMIGTAQREAKPILREDLFQMLAQMDDSVKGKRDKALLLIGFAGAFRRSELVGLDVADIQHVRQGVVITVRRSKTDQTGAGRKIGVPFGRTLWCPVRHLIDWLDHAGIEDGPIFRSVKRHGKIAEQRLSGEAVCLIIKERAEAAGFDPGAYSGHSLRAGFCTSAAIAGASMWKIRQQSGHTSESMLSRYLREADLFRGNAADHLL